MAAAFIVGCGDRHGKIPAAHETWCSAERPWEVVACGGDVEERSPSEFADFVRREYPFLWAQDWVRVKRDPSELTPKEIQQLRRIRLMRLSKGALIVDELIGHEDDSRRLSHVRYDCVKRYRVRRTTELDELFDATSMEAKFSYAYKGIGQESTTPNRLRRSPGGENDDMTRALGKPDYSYPGFQLMLMSAYYYEHDDVHVFCWGGRVMYVEHGRPGWLANMEWAETNRRNQEKATANDGKEKLGD